jgi:hypothetical protein
MALGESIGVILAYEFGEGKALYQPLDGEIAQTLRGLFRTSDPNVLRQLTFLAQLNSSFVKDIPNQIKNKVLDWALSLEAAGVTGENQSFTDPEKQLARLLNFVINDNSTNIHAGTMQGVFQVGSPQAIQNATITIDSKVADAIDKIANAVASSQELDDVDKQDIRASLALIKDLAAKEQTTKSKMKLNEKLSAIATTISIATGLVPVVEPLLHLIRAKLGL